jgi:hypothetical protein
MANSTPSDHVTRHYASGQEMYHAYVELRERYQDGVNFVAFMHAILRHPILSRVTRHMGNNLNQYMNEAATTDQIRQIRQSFEEVVQSYDHDLNEPVTFPEKIAPLRLYWLTVMCYETMDFNFMFIRIANRSVSSAVMSFLGEIQEKNGDLMNADSQVFDAGFMLMNEHTEQQKKINAPQLLWDAMLDRDVAMAYVERYFPASGVIEPTEDTTASRHLH